MCSRQTMHSIDELRKLRIEIKNLREKPITGIINRIQSLKRMNQLLKQQNELLLMRQQMFRSKNSIVDLKKEGFLLRVS